jgi:hypothetical protein
LYLEKRTAKGSTMHAGKLYGHVYQTLISVNRVMTMPYGDVVRTRLPQLREIGEGEAEIRYKMNEEKSEILY